MTDTKIKELRNFLSLTFAKLVCIIILLVALTWAFSSSINVHDDWLFWVSVLTGAAIPIVVLWSGVSFFLNIRRFLTKFNS